MLNTDLLIRPHTRIAHNTLKREPDLLGVIPDRKRLHDLPSRLFRLNAAADSALAAALDDDATTYALMRDRLCGADALA
jgi:hypothetical protein